MKAMKIYLDDERPTPAGWLGCCWPEEVIEYLKTKQVTKISLDHDLGDDNRGTGYDVLLWIEEQVLTNNFIPPEIHVHSANPTAKQRMLLAINSINRFSKKL